MKDADMKIKIQNLHEFHFENFYIFKNPTSSSPKWEVWELTTPHTYIGTWDSFKKAKARIMRLLNKC